MGKNETQAYIRLGVPRISRIFLFLLLLQLKFKYGCLRKIDSLINLNYPNPVLMMDVPLILVNSILTMMGVLITLDNSSLLITSNNSRLKQVPDYRLAPTMSR